jgi:ABC-type transport system substrate-binding protein
MPRGENDAMKLGPILGSLTLAATLAGAPPLARPAAAQPGQSIVVAAVAAPRGVDGDVWVPGSIEAVVNVYESLVRYARRTGANGQVEIDPERIEPHLAESWTVSPDGKEYVFTLRRGVRSFFGNELTAADVVFGYEKSRSQGRTGRFIAEASRVESVEALSSHQVRYRLSEPNNLFLRALTHYVPMVVDSTEAKKHATPEDPYATRWLATNTAGFGAYHMQTNRAGEGAVFVANPNYFGGRVALQRVVYREVPSSATRMSLLQAGQVHIAEELSQTQVRELRNDRRVQVASALGTGSATVRMNPGIAPFDDARIRRAIIHAVDFDALNRSVFEGLGTRSRSILPPSIPGYVEAYTYERDLDRARALLREAGHPDGIEVTLNYTTAFWWEEPLVLQLRSQLAQAGIRVNPVRLANTEFAARGAIGRRDLPFATHLANVFVLDPGYALFLSAHSRGSSNRNNYAVPEFDRLVETGIAARDPEEAKAAVAAAQRRHAEDATFIDTFFPGTFVPMHTCIRGWIWYPTNRVVWRDLSCQG